ncbi:unnamed protein product, partial [Closterium sp. Naga37s-1]
LIASGDKQQQHEEGNATSPQAGPGIPIDPSRITRLSWQPRAFLYSGFLSHDECDHLITLARDKVTRSSVADNESGKSVLSAIRTSSGTFLNKYQDDVVKRIEERIAAWTFLPKEHGEAIQILKYEIGQKYDAHFDYFFDAVNTQMGGHRVATVLMYLTTVEEGGETVFPSSQPRPPMDVTKSECANRGLAVKPQKGDALLFYSLHPDGTTDQSSLHASCPVIRGEKWSATKWIHPSVRMIDGAALLPAQVLRNLSDKLYDKRKAAALEIETAVKAAVAEGNDERINAIISLLANDYATSAQPNQRKGGLIGLAAVTVGLGPDASQYLDVRLAAVTVGLGPDASQYLDVRLAAVTVGRFPDTSQYLDVRVVGGGEGRERGVRIVPEVLKSFSDSDSRVRYYACEALYNIAKVTRGDFIVFFNDVFNALCKLSADLDPNVQSAAHLLDRLVKDIVTVSDQFSIEEFIPLLRAHMSVLNPFVQQFLVGWITVLDSVPDIDMLGFLPDPQDGGACPPSIDMLGFLPTPRMAVEYGRMMEILVQRAGSSDEFTRLTAVTWLMHALCSAALNPHEGLSLLPSAADLMQINDFVKLGGAQMMPYYAAVVGAILPCIADREEKIAAVRLAAAVVGAILPCIADLEEKIAAIVRDTNEEQFARVKEQSMADGVNIARDTNEEQLARVREQSVADLKYMPRDTNEEQLARVREQSVADGFDVRAVVEIARRELSSSWEATRLEALAWIATLLHRFPHQVCFYGRFPIQLLDLMDDPSTALLESLLAALADDSDQVLFLCMLSLSLHALPFSACSPFLCMLSLSLRALPFSACSPFLCVLSLSLHALPFSACSPFLCMLQLHSYCTHPQPHPPCRLSPFSLPPPPPHPPRQGSIIIRHLCATLDAHKVLRELAFILQNERGSIIIRHLCAMLDADKVFRELAFILQNESDCEFRRHHRAHALPFNLIPLNPLLLSPFFLTIPFPLLRRGSIIIRHLCAMLDADKVLRELAFILQNESDCQFAATIVPTLSLILLTAPELAPIRSKLRRSFAAAPAPAAAYEHAWSIVDSLEESDLSLSLMVQVDKLVLLLETPIFSRLRLQLLDPSRSPALLKALYGLLMLLPQ